MRRVDMFILPLWQRMTAHEGYVWFLPSWYSPYWWDVNHHNRHSHKDDELHVPCSTENMLYAIDGHFVLSKTISDSDQTIAIGNFTVGKFKQMYAEKIGKAVSLDKGENVVLQ